jgi:uncharacterized membrane protein YhaH (DUF805 family)
MQKEGEMEKLKEVSLHLVFTVFGALFALLGMHDTGIAMISTQDLTACGGCGTVIFIMIAIFVINIIILVWVAKDAKARGMGSPIGWLILVFFTGILGLIIYYFARPSGDKTLCPNCSNLRLSSMMTCPHCGNSKANTPSRPAEPYVPPAPASSGQKFCSACGAKIDADNAFCQECGKPVS